MRGVDRYLLWRVGLRKCGGPIVFPTTQNRRAGSGPPSRYFALLYLWKLVTQRTIASSRHLSMISHRPVSGLRRCASPGGVSGCERRYAATQDATSVAHCVKLRGIAASPVTATLCGQPGGVLHRATRPIGWLGTRNGAAQQRSSAASRHEKRRGVSRRGIAEAGRTS